MSEIVHVFYRERRHGLLRVLLRQLNNPLIWALFGAAVPLKGGVRPLLQDELGRMGTEPLSSKERRIMSNDNRTTRRDLLLTMGGLGAAALLANCGNDSTGTPTGSDGGTTGSDGGTTGSWATAGTSVLSGKDYGNPFASGVGSTCNVYKSATEGPCHATSNLLVRKDLSEGYAGLPTRLEFLIVDSSCNPVPNATLEIWHCDTLGVYSGDIDGNNDAMCTGGDSKAAAALWYRGIQTAGSDGRVTFDTNFPGWYASRATHIHFKVTVGATTYLTSQVFFDESLKTEIYNAQPNYKATSGQGYQVNAMDKVVTESAMTLSDVIMSTAKQSDGALLAWKAIKINS